MDKVKVTLTHLPCSCRPFLWTWLVKYALKKCIEVRHNCPIVLYDELISFWWSKIDMTSLSSNTFYLICQECLFTICTYSIICSVLVCVLSLGTTAGMHWGSFFFQFGAICYFKDTIIRFWWTKVKVTVILCMSHFC